MQWRLPVPPAFVHARRIRGEHPAQEIRAVQLGGRARIGNRSGLHQPGRDVAAGEVERVKAAGPPVAAAVRIGAELEQELDHGQVPGAREVDEGRSVEREDGSIDQARRSRQALDERAQSLEVATLERTT
jgi:hypothetical protein